MSLIDFGLKKMTVSQQLQEINQFSLYDQDFYLWLETTAKQLKDKKFDELDLVSLIEEIESMGRSEKRAIESNLRIILLHLLKYKYQPQKRSNSWKYSLSEHRLRVSKALKDSPSLKRYLPELLVECYQDSRRLASDETGLSREIFPFQSPFTLEETLNLEFLPD